MAGDDEDGLGAEVEAEYFLGLQSGCRSVEKLVHVGHVLVCVGDVWNCVAEHWRVLVAIWFPEENTNRHDQDRQEGQAHREGEVTMLFNAHVDCEVSQISLL